MRNGIKLMSQTIKPTKHSLISLYQRGAKVMEEDHKKREKEKLNTLRIGSAGCILEDGTVLGTSPFQALARFCGYQFEPSNRAKMIFEGGFMVEAMWEEKLTNAGLAYKCEEDIPMSDTTAGYPRTGRPDMVAGNIRDEVFEPVFGNEFKSVASVKTAKQVFEDMIPKDEHFIQACGYMKYFKIPWLLLYMSTSIHKLFEAAKNLKLEDGATFTAHVKNKEFDKAFKEVVKITKHGVKDALGKAKILFEKNPEYSKSDTRAKEYKRVSLLKDIFDDEGTLLALHKLTKEIQPQQIEYKIGVEEGKFYYTHPTLGTRHETKVTEQGIDDYYKLIIRMFETGDLSLGKLAQVDMFGSKLFYDRNLYDEFQVMADPADYDYKLGPWLDRLSELVNNPYLIQLRKENGIKKYQVCVRATEERVTSFDTREEAIEFIDNNDKPKGTFKL